MSFDQTDLLSNLFERMASFFFFVLFSVCCFYLYSL